MNFRNGILYLFNRYLTRYLLSSRFYPYLLVEARRQVAILARRAFFGYECYISPCIVVPPFAGTTQMRLAY